MSDDPLKKFGLVIKALRVNKQLSQEALADMAGLDRSFLSQIETGRKQPSLLTILRLAAAFELPASELLQRMEELLPSSPSQL